MGRHAKVTESKATAASVGLEKARACVRECVEELISASDVLKGCKAQEKVLDAALLVERGAALMRDVADELQRVITAATPPSQLPDRGERLVRWFSLSPEIQSRFVNVMSHMRTLAFGESQPIAELAERLGLSSADGPKRIHETESYLRPMWKVNMLARSTDSDGRTSYSLSIEARTLLDSGAFAALGLPAAAV